jgi:hypothetical protein
VGRKQLIAGIVLFVVLMILCVSGSSIALNEWKNRRGHVGHREPLPGLGYCSSKQIRPCILSFNLNPNGGMLINILVRGFSEDFYVKTKHKGSEYIYECKKNSQYSTHVSCTGKTMPIGEMFSFLIVSTEENVTLAEGSFSIVGLALATPEIAITPTPLINHSPR